MGKSSADSIVDFEERVSLAVEKETGKSFTFSFSTEARLEIHKQAEMKGVTVETALERLESQIVAVCCQDFDDNITLECSSIELGHSIH
jgi:hypothetical protein